jgi:outer membrane protein assembly factor BamD (BamD/ComL family)
MKEKAILLEIDVSSPYGAELYRQIMNIENIKKAIGNFKEKLLPDPEGYEESSEIIKAHAEYKAGAKDERLRLFKEYIKTFSEKPI